MAGEVFTIEFIFQGLEYWGIVTSNESEREATFVIRYCIERARRFEKTIKLCAKFDKATDMLEWSEVGRSVSDPKLINIIGEALADRVLS